MDKRFTKGTGFQSFSRINKRVDWSQIALSFWFEYHYWCCYWCNIFKWYVLLYSTEVLGAMATTGLLAEGGSVCVLAAGVALLFKSAEIAVQNSNSGWQWSSGSDLTKRYEKSDNGKTGFLKSIDLTNELYQRNTLSSIDFEAYHYNMLGFI